MNIVNDVRFAGVSNVVGTATFQVQRPGGSPDFAELYKSALHKDVEFSAHATARLKSRNITVTPEMMDKLNTAVSGAEKKGARDSLVLMKDLAFIVNIPNKKVITAMDRESVTDNIFTNIDSAVFAG